MHRPLLLAVSLLLLAWSTAADAVPRHRRGRPGFRRPGPPPRHFRPPTCTGQAGSCGFIDDLRSVTETAPPPPTQTATPDTAPPPTTENTTVEDSGTEDNHPTPTTQSSGDVPYFYQYANKLNKGSSCQNTSLAMLLKYYGVDITPDDITARFGKDKAQSPEGLASVFNTLAAEAGIPQRLESHRDGSMADLNAQLQAGTPTIVHGYFTGSGHVVLATGYDGSSYTVNDPAGKWSGSFKGGYSGAQSATSGDGVIYSSSSFYSAVGTSNGSSHLPLWWHEVYTVR